jgi:hypothetical protein
MGWPDTALCRDMALAEHLGCEAGRALHDLPVADRAGLWEAVKVIRRVYATYWAVHGLPAPVPQPSSIAMLADMPECDDGPSGPAQYDSRTIEERSQAATSAMMRVEGLLLRTRYASAVKSAVLRDEDVRSRADLVLGLVRFADSY